MTEDGTKTMTVIYRSGRSGRHRLSLLCGEVIDACRDCLDRTGRQP